MLSLHLLIGLQTSRSQASSEHKVIKIVPALREHSPPCELCRNLDEGKVREKTFCPPGRNQCQDAFAQKMSWDPGGLTHHKSTGNITFELQCAKVLGTSCGLWLASLHLHRGIDSQLVCQWPPWSSGVDSITTLHGCVNGLLDFSGVDSTLLISTSTDFNSVAFNQIHKAPVTRRTSLHQQRLTSPRSSRHSLLNLFSNLFLLILLFCVRLIPEPSSSSTSTAATCRVPISFRVFFFKSSNK